MADHQLGEKQKAVAEIYDKTAGQWEDLLGEHLHEGFYDPGVIAAIPDHKLAVTRLVDEALRLANISDDPAKKPKKMLDVGCGLGGTCLHIARKYDIQCKGITISPEQVKCAQAFAAAQGLESKVSFEVGDALDLPYPDGHFDLIFSVQCIEHVQNKEKFIHEMVRVAAPGATIVLVSFIRRELSPSEESLKPEEKQLLQKIYDAFVLSSFCPMSDYMKWFTALSLQDIKTEDWTQNMLPFWPLLLKIAFSWKGFTSLLRNGGWRAFKVVFAAKPMMKAANDGLSKFIAISCRKPE